MSEDKDQSKPPSKPPEDKQVEPPKRSVDPGAGQRKTFGRRGREKKG